MKLFNKINSILLTIFVIIISAFFAYGLNSVEIFSHPDSINSATVTSNKLATVAYDFIYQVLEGNIANHSYVKLKGHSHSVGLTDQELSALNTAGFGNWPAAAAGVVLVSTDIDDDGDPASTGARTVIIRGLDANWNLITATVTMNGTTPTAATAQTFIRINELEVVTAGSSLTNEGDITASISGTNIIRIYAIHSTSEGGRYTVPAGYEGYFTNLEASAIGNKEITFHVFYRDNTVSNAAFVLKGSWHTKDGGFRPDGMIESATQKTDVVIVTHAELAGAKASASLEGWIEN